MTPLKILFVLPHGGHLRNFESTIWLLAEQGHRIHLAFMDEKEAVVDTQLLVNGSRRPIKTRSISQGIGVARISSRATETATEKLRRDHLGAGIEKGEARMW